MKRNVLTVALIIAGTLSMASSLTLSGYQARRDNSPEVKEVKVSAKSIARLPAEKKYIVDLTRGGTVYQFDPGAGPIDFRRVAVRTARGEQAIGPWMEKAFSGAMKEWDSQTFRIGTAADSRRNSGIPLLVRDPTPAGSTFQCGEDFCSCTGIRDCLDLARNGACEGPWGCSDSSNSCLCARRAI